MVTPSGNVRLIPFPRHPHYSWTHYDVLRRIYVRRLTFDDLYRKASK